MEVNNIQEQANVPLPYVAYVSNSAMAYKVSCMASFNNMTPQKLMECAANDGVSPEQFVKDVQEFWQTMVN